MNIFVTDSNPIIAAHNLCDQHVRSKMQIEGAIMLAHAFPQEVLNYPSTPRTQKGTPRKSGKGYVKHQCSIWARESIENFRWLVDHTLEMFTERMLRWPTAAEHFTHQFIKWCKDNIHNTTITKTELTPYAVAFKSDSICLTVPNFNKLTAIDQYRKYIIHDKKFATWTYRKSPEWFIS